MIRRVVYGAFFLGYGFVVMLLWNWLLPNCLGASRISFLEALGILLLCGVLRGVGMRGVVEGVSSLYEQHTHTL